MSKKFHHLSLNGIAESVRYILHYGGQKFEDIRYELPEWPTKSVEDLLPDGRLPLYQEGNRTLNQSLAIARYVAGQLKLMPTDPWEQAWLDAIVFNIYDFWNKVVTFIKETDGTRKEAIKREIINESIDFFFSRFEKELKANKGFFNGKLSWADFVLVGILESANLFLGLEIEQQYPTVNALVHTVRTLPGVKQYLAIRKPYTLQTRTQ